MPHDLVKGNGFGLIVLKKMVALLPSYRDSKTNRPEISWRFQRVLGGFLLQIRK